MISTLAHICSQLLFNWSLYDFAIVSLNKIFEKYSIFCEGFNHAILAWYSITIYSEVPKQNSYPCSEIANLSNHLYITSL